MIHSIIIPNTKRLCCIIYFYLKYYYYYYDGYDYDDYYLRLLLYFSYHNWFLSSLVHILFIITHINIQTYTHTYNIHTTYIHITKKQIHEFVYCSYFTHNKELRWFIIIKQILWVNKIMKKKQYTNYSRRRWRWRGRDMNGLKIERFMN